MKRKRESSVDVRLRPLVTTAWAVVVLALVLAGGAGADKLPQQKADECNSDLTIGQAFQGPPGPAGQVVRVTLTQFSLNSRDSGPPASGNPVGQTFDGIRYRPDCNGIMPCNLVPPAGPVEFLGVVGGTCSGMNSATPPNPGPGCMGVPIGVAPSVGANVLADEIFFDFSPDLCLIKPNIATPVSCTIVFDVRVPPQPQPPTPPVTYTSEASSNGICLNPLDPTGTFNSSVTVTSSFTPPVVVPTLSEWALLLMTLILLTVGILAIRRRSRRA